ncbi:ATP-grasp domain-containing protein [Streptacidiphilus jiangxiensis]|uniref:ATP-grasp domain-containing protein n=1 Tax=Streptacidiphilus jiangxiensis TaxID=235985 RepID=A0A1H7ZE60_STRJI|nr:ATP-grasp domain-containing protein [Streptacidiphilus jiangxiensis]SEM56626.1 ATP-grasp domain-containing protein [Streptacidiphilus jiangxiensis]
MKPRAFVLLGGLRVILRNRLYLDELSRRGLAILVLTGEEWRAEAARQLATEDGPITQIAEIGFARGTVGVEGGFTADTVAQVLAWRARYELSGVLAAGEMLVEQTGVVADLLGLPSPGLRATRVCRNKYLQRAYLAGLSPAAVVLPPGGRAEAAAEAGASLSFPAVLKPSGRRSSSGVRTVADPAELAACLADYPAEETLLVEEYVHGPEYSVEALVDNGRVVFESVTAKGTNEGGAGRFVELSHTVPEPPGPARDALLAANRTVVAALGFGSGVIHSELRLTPDGRALLMEAAARTPGDGILPLYHLATGHALEPDIIALALGEPVDHPTPTRCARQVYLETPPGVLQDVRIHLDGAAEPLWAADGEAWPVMSPGRPGDAPALRAVLVLQEPGGSVVGAFEESGDRVVTFLIDAATPQELDQYEAVVRQAIEVTIAPAATSADASVGAPVGAPVGL